MISQGIDSQHQSGAGVLVEAIHGVDVPHVAVEMMFTRICFIRSTAEYIKHAYFGMVTPCTLQHSRLLVRLAVRVSVCLKVRRGNLGEQR